MYEICTSTRLGFLKLVQPTDQLVYEVVHRLSSLDQQDDPPGLLQLGHHVFQGLGSDHLGAFSLII